MDTQLDLYKNTDVITHPLKERLSRIRFDYIPHKTITLQAITNPRPNLR